MALAAFPPARNADTKSPLGPQDICQAWIFTRRPALKSYTSINKTYTNSGAFMFRLFVGQQNSKPEGQIRLAKEIRQVLESHLHIKCLPQA